MKNYYIGIDPGVSTGLAIWDAYNEKWEGIFTLNIIKSMEKVLKYHNKETLSEVVCEDARLVRYKTDPIKAQGAGSIKRDCKVWEEFFVPFPTAPAVFMPIHIKNKNIYRDVVFVKLT